MFHNRLLKVYRHIGRQAARQQISCFRFYDHDLPEFPFIIEQYGPKLYVAEYQRRHALSEEQHGLWLEECIEVLSDTLQFDKKNIYLKLRKRKESRTAQYQKLDEAREEFIVEENGLKFIVNLSDYLDTGLFLDHRITRQIVGAESSGKSVLNLFAYTGSFSVYAAAGGARSVHTIDLSKTYLTWAERNMQLNFPEFRNAAFIHADVLQYMATVPDSSFDLIVMDPPTFSNSKRMKDFLDIQQDHVSLINECMRVLTRGGVLYFSTNYTRFALDEKNINASAIKDITRATTPFDFWGKLKRQCFKIIK
jgi:23S rRNA (cytosine1962-C5)-methyltransferase